MKGGQKINTDLYILELSTDNVMTETQIPDKFFAKNIYECNYKVNLVQYLHQVCWSLAKKTWIQSIKKNFFVTWHGLTAEFVQKHLPKSESTVKGHLKTFKNIRSIQTSSTIIKSERIPQDDDVLKFTKQNDNTRAH